MQIFIIIIVLLIFTALTLLVFLHYSVNNSKYKGTLKNAVDVQVEKFLHKGDVNTLVVGLYKGGKSYIKAYGEDEADENAVFQIGSITKVFTALLLQILCDEKVVYMDQTLGELIGSEYKLSEAAKTITLRRLATHTSGLPSIPEVLHDHIIEQVGKESQLINPYSHLDIASIFNYLSTTEDNHKIGKFVYSNYGMGLLAHVLEFVSNQPFELLLQEKILSPLAMTSTGITLADKMHQLLVQGFTSDGNHTPLWTFDALAGAGALNSTAADMLKFIEVNIDGNTSISNALQQMAQPQFNGKTGIGWMKPSLIEKFFKNKNSVWHNGMVGGYASYLSIDESDGSGLIILANKAIDVTMLGVLLTQKLRTQSWS